MTVTVLPASAVPAMVGVALLVSAVVTVGALGAVVSMVSVWVPGVETLPAASVAVTDTAFVPLAFKLSVPVTGVAVDRSRLQFPPVAVVV